MASPGIINNTNAVDVNIQAVAPASTSGPVLAHPFTKKPQQQSC